MLSGDPIEGAGLAIFGSSDHGRFTSDYGHIGTKTIAVADTVTTTQAKVSDSASDSPRTPSFYKSRGASDHGRVGTRTSTIPGTATTSETRVSESGSDSPKTPIVTTTQNLSEYSRIGMQTVTETPPHPATTITGIVTELKNEFEGGGRFNKQWAVCKFNDPD
ncbi:hypothetical protein F5Y10DRAFT_273762 [Nemania abortiva]|nr:hypothetical protein F5Y10DRAFT_273762 [Nemania abortiva]